MTETSAPLARTPLHTWHVARNAHMVVSDGWHVVDFYSTKEQEVASTRQGVGIADISSFAKINVVGQAVPILTWSMMGMGPAMKPLGVTPFMANGPVLGCRLADDQLLLLASSTISTGLEQYLLNACRGQAVLQHNSTAGLAAFWLIGPKTDALLRRVTSLDISRCLPSEGGCAHGPLLGVQALFVRSLEMEEPSVRVHVPWEYGEYVWTELLETGASIGAVPIGLDALHALMKLRASNPAPVAGPSLSMPPRA